MLKNRIVPYSVIKIIENKPPLYSVLNPDTNSDSPSEKSKGVRLDSAKIIINHIIIAGTNKVVCNLLITISLKEYDWISQHIKKINRKMLTSYEIAWATDR